MKQKVEFEIDIPDGKKAVWKDGKVVFEDIKLLNTKEKASLQTNNRAWLHLVSDVLTWKDGIGQYLDNPEVQELAKRLCNKYAQKLYNPSVLSNSSSTIENEQKSTDKVVRGDTLTRILNIQEQYCLIQKNKK